MLAVEQVERVLQTMRTHWVACMLIMVAACLMSTFKKSVRSSEHKARQATSQTTPRQDTSSLFAFLLGFVHYLRPADPPPAPEPLEQPPFPARRRKNKMRYQKTARQPKTKKAFVAPAAPVYTVPRTMQPYDAFLVLDLEGTCELGTDFSYPNEIIEFPVRLLQWTDRADDGSASVLEPVAEFRTFVKPTWRPKLSAFCTQLTGITQEQVDTAPRFSEALAQLEAFLVKHALVDPETKKCLKRFCWCSDGPWDIRDFFVKQCFISQLAMPEWIRGNVLDVRSVVAKWRSDQTGRPAQVPPSFAVGEIRTPLNISAQLKALDLPAFEGRQHSGIDDTRNIARIVTELARRGIPLVPNTTIYPGRRWRWMGKHGQVLEDAIP